MSLDQSTAPINGKNSCATTSLTYENAAHRKCIDIDDEAGSQPHSDHFKQQEMNAPDDVNAQEMKELASCGSDGSVDGMKSENPVSCTLKSRKSAPKAEENGLAKGVVLNAQLIANPSKFKWVPENGVNQSKDQKLAGSFKVPRNSEKTDLKKAKQMTVLRKIAFGFSFLPSVLFILCFSIILPCEEPHPTELCGKKLWTRSLNNTELVTSLGITHEVLVGLSRNKEGLILSLNRENGNDLWSWSLQTKPHYINCKDMDVNGDGSPDCVIVDRSGWLYAVNTSDGYTFWNRSAVSLDHNPVLLTDCNGNGAVAFVDDYKTIKILSKGNRLSTLDTMNCSVTKSHSLMAWVRGNETGLVFSCKSSKNIDGLMFIHQDSKCLWQPMVKHNGDTLYRFEDLKDALFLSMPDGFVVWSENFTVYLGSDNQEIWSVQTSNHSQQRYLMYGNFSFGEHIVLISFNADEGMLVTFLSCSDGNKTFSWFLPNTKGTTSLKKVLPIPGDKYHHLLVLFEEMQRTEVKPSSKAHSLEENNVGMTNETVARTSQKTAKTVGQTLKQKITSFHFEKKLLDIEVLRKELFVETYDVIRETEKDATDVTALVQDQRLIIILGKTVFEKNTGYVTHLTNIKVENWDTPSSYCSYTR